MSQRSRVLNISRCHLKDPVIVGGKAFKVNRIALISDLSAFRTKLPKRKYWEFFRENNGILG